MNPVRVLGSCLIAFMLVMLGWFALAIFVGYVGYMGVSVLLWGVLVAVVYRTST